MLVKHALSHALGHSFRHNEQSRRIVEVLEKNGTGLNLTYVVREGIAHALQGPP
jgi:dGTPase